MERCRRKTGMTGVGGVKPATLATVSAGTHRKGTATQIKKRPTRIDRKPDMRVHLLLALLLPSRRLTGLA